MNKQIINILRAVFILTLTGCHVFEVSMIEKHIDNNEFLKDGKDIYYLPKTQFDVEIPVVITTTTLLKDGFPVEEIKKKYKVNGDVKVTPKLVPGYPAIINSKRLLDAALFDSDFHITKTDDGMLATISNTTTDVTAKTIKNAASLIVAVAETLPMKAEPPSPEVIAALEQNREKLAKRIDEINAIDSISNINQLKENMEKRELIEQYLKSVNERLDNERKRITKIKEVEKTSIKFTIKPEKLGQQAPGKIPIQDVKFEIITTIKAYEPNITYDPNSIGNVFKKKLFGKEKIVTDGLLYRIPVPCTFTIKIKDAGEGVSNDQAKTIFDDIVMITQFGPTTKVPLKWKFLGVSMTVATLSTTTGGLTDFQIKTTDQSDENSQNIEALIKSIEEYKKAQKEQSESEPSAGNQ